MSKLGVHVASDKRTGFGDLLRAGAPLVVTVDQNVIAESHTFGAFVAFRTQRGPLGEDNMPGLIDAPASQVSSMADQWMASLKPIYDLNPGADCYIVNNELDVSTLASGVNLNLFYLRCMEVADQWNIKIGICSFSTGNPTDDNGLTLEQRWLPLLPAVRRAADHGHYIVLHAHRLTGVSMIKNSEDESLRHQRSLRYFASNGLKPKVIIGELSNGVGGVEPTLEEYMLNVEWWDKQVMNSVWRDQVIGGALYGFNAAETIRAAVPNLVQWIEANPTPTDPIEPPAGLGDPRVDYARTVNVIYPGTSFDRAVEILKYAFEHNLESIGWSYDDAMVGKLTQRTAKLWDVPIDKRAALLSFRDTYYPGVVVQFLGGGTPPPPAPAAKVIRGLNMRADGHSMQKDFDCITLGKLNGAKLMTNNDFTELNSLISIVPVENIILRLHAAGDNPALGDAQRFFNEQNLWLREFNLRGGRLVEIHNEPNLSDEGFGLWWKDAAGFGVWYSHVVALIRVRYSNLRCGYPGLSPNTFNEPDFISNLQWLIAAGLVDWIGAHAYWIDAADMNVPANGRHYRLFLNRGKPVYITEFSNVRMTDTDLQKGQQYKAYFESLEAGVAGAYVFVSSATDQTFNATRQTWVRDGKITEIVRGLV